MSENSIRRQQAGLIRWAKTSLRDSADLAGDSSGDKFVVSRPGEAYDVRARDPNRKFRLTALLHLEENLPMPQATPHVRPLSSPANTQAVPLYPSNFELD